LDWYQTVFELIDMRSFSNLWYWIALAVLWSSTAHYVLGVPFDLVQRAARSGGQADADLRDMVRINVNRILYIAGAAGIWLVALGSCLLTVLASLGWGYGNEFCQALFLLLFPLSLVALLSSHTARHIHANAIQGKALYKRLKRHRFFTQAIGMVSIFVTAFWGMLQNMQIGVLGG